MNIDLLKVIRSYAIKTRLSLAIRVSVLALASVFKVLQEREGCADPIASQGAVGKSKWMSDNQSWAQEISPPQTSVQPFSSPPPQQLCLIYQGPAMGPGSFPTSSQQRASADPMEEAKDKQGFNQISTAVCSSVPCISSNATWMHTD